MDDTVLDHLSCCKSFVYYRRLINKRGWQRNLSALGPCQLGQLGQLGQLSQLGQLGR